MVKRGSNAAGATAGTTGATTGATAKKAKTAEGETSAVGN
jgi:hypothetical protein